MEVLPSAAVWSWIADGAGSLTNRQIVLILGVATVSYFLLSATRRRFQQRQTSPKAYAREQRSRLQSEQSVIADIEELMAQLEQFSRQMQARIDTRYAKMEAILRHADERIDTLERLLRRSEGRPVVDLTVDDSSEQDLPQPEFSEDRSMVAYRLADAGLSVQEIAAELSASVGEVELILALRRASAGAPSLP